MTVDDDAVNAEAADASAAEADVSWCLGLPFVEFAPFTAEEAVAIHLRLRALLIGLIAVALVPVALLAMSSWTPRTNAEDDLLTTAAFVIVLVVLPAVFLFGVRFATRFRLLRRDAKAGVVSVFRGEVRARTPNRVRDRIERAARTRMPDEGSLEVRALPHSRAWLRPSSSPGRFEFLRVHLQHAAPPPAYAWRVPVHRDLPVVPMPGIQLEQRQLTALERVEIASYVRELRVPDWRLLYRLGVCVLFLVWGAQERSMGGHGILLFIGGAALAWNARTYWRRLSLAARLRADLTLGRVLTASRAEADTPEEAGSTSAPAAADGVRREFLPISQRLWTEVGRPASWREAGKQLRAAA